jgi:hypothetical protein
MQWSLLLERWLLSSVATKIYTSARHVDDGVHSSLLTCLHSCVWTQAEHYWLAMTHKPLTWTAVLAYCLYLGGPLKTKVLLYQS